MSYEIDAYRDASVVSALAAGVAATLYSFFNDGQNYRKQKIDNCSWELGNCPQLYYIAIGCYFAVAANLVAAVDAFIVMDWARKRAAGHNHVPKPMLWAGRCVWFFSFYSGIALIIVPIVKYVMIEGKPRVRPGFYFFILISTLLFCAYLVTEIYRVYRLFCGHSPSESPTKPERGIRDVEERART